MLPAITRDKHSFVAEKYIGSSCNLFNGASCDVTDCAGGVDCCACDVYIADSECTDANVCACRSGRYSKDLGTTCTVSK